MQKQFELNCRGRLWSLQRPVIMGIINATPDSFYTRDRYVSLRDKEQLAAGMVEAGAAILDIGGMSTRPGAEEITLEEERSRVLPLIRSLKKAFPEILISIDTYRSRIAEEAVLAGADMVNDVSAGNMDPAMAEVVAALEVPFIAMHMQGTPRTMQQHPVYEDVAKDILDFFIKKITALEQAGIRDIIIDPGFGFGKSLEHNYQLLGKLHTFSILEKPLLAGISRKSMLYRLLQISPDDALNATTAANMLLLMQGAAILRVHDVREAVECVKLYEYYRQFLPGNIPLPEK